MMQSYVLPSRLVDFYDTISKMLKLKTIISDNIGSVWKNGFVTPQFLIFIFNIIIRLLG